MKDESSVRANMFIQAIVSLDAADKAVVIVTHALENNRQHLLTNEDNLPLPTEEDEKTSDVGRNVSLPDMFLKKHAQESSARPCSSDAHWIN